MAYSDYGGYAFRNGERVIERSDFTITPDGGYGTPGVYPGLVAVVGGRKPEIRHPYAHAVLGDGPLYVGLYKQSDVLLYVVDGDEIKELYLADFAGHLPAEKWGEHEGKRYLKTLYEFVEDTEPTVFTVADHKLEVCWCEEDNYYLYARLTQPDGVIWTGWSGYGVGAGLENCGYGFSTEERNQTLAELFPAPSGTVPDTEGGE